MKEIGGYFELERFSGKPYHEGAIELNCGRSCLEYLIDLRSISTIWLPDYICDSVYRLCEKKRVAVKRYSVDSNFSIDFNFQIGAGEYLYLVDYFGQLSDSMVQQGLEISRGNLIVDESQGFFNLPRKDIDTLYTCRKYFGVADGAYLYTKGGERLSEDLAISESHHHMDFVLGRYEEGANKYFEKSKANNARFSEEGLREMSSLTRNFMNAIDYENARAARERNWLALDEALGKSNLLKLTLPCGPFMYPFYSEKIEGVRKAMAGMKVYVPTLWPNVLIDSSKEAPAYKLANNILPLPVDQRYDERDMDRIVEVLQKCLS